MCYAIPGKVIALDGKFAIVDYFGEKKKALNEFAKLRIGDYIYAQGGYVIQIIPEDEALSILATWKETFFELQALDLRLSRIDLETKGIDKNLLRILDRALENLPLKDEDLLYLLSLQTTEELALLYKTANFLRQKYLSNSCCVHGIIEFSNYCAEACQYCGISTHNALLHRYRMTIDEIVASAGQAIEKYGFKALVLQSGEDKLRSVEELCTIIKKIKQQHAVLIFMSVGEVGLEGIASLYAAGARGLLLRFETSNPQLYAKLHPGSALSYRLAHLEEAYRLGYLIITGGLIGLPGQTREDQLNDILLAKKLHTEMYSFGPFLPHPATPLCNCPPPSVDEVLKVLAVSRMVDAQNAKIVVTTGFETLSGQARSAGLMAGANSVMLNVTPQEYRQHYQIYPLRAHNDESLALQIEETLKTLRSLGRAPTDLGVG